MKDTTLESINSVLYHRASLAADGVIDGLYLAGSLFVNAPLFWGESSDEANEFQAYLYHSDELIVAILLSLLFASFAAVWRCAKPGESDWSDWIRVYWPDIRNFLRGLKNGHHAVVNVTGIAQCFMRYSLLAIASPTAIVFGGLLAINFIYYKRMRDKRTKGLKANKALLNQIQESNWGVLPDDQVVFRYSKGKRMTNYASAGFDGLLDGLYLYGCLMVLIGFGVSGFSGGALLVLALALIGVYGISSFAVRMHDEYESQKTLEVSALNCDIALLKNEKKSLEENLADMLPENDPYSQYKQHFSYVKKEKAQIETRIQAINELLIQKNNEHQQLTQIPDDANRTWIEKCVFKMGRGCLSGVKNAKAAFYSVGLMCNNIVATVVFGILGAIACVVYGTYLTLFALSESMRAKPSPHVAQSAISARPSSDSMREPLLSDSRTRSNSQEDERRRQIGGFLVNAGD